MRNITLRPAISKSERMIHIIISALFFIYSLLVIILITYTILNSFKSQSEIINDMFKFPQGINLDSYRTIINEQGYMVSFLNSVFVTFLGTLGVLLLSSLTAFGMSRFHFKGKRFLEVYLLFGMMFPIQISILPLFIILRTLNLVNNRFGLILVYVSGISFAVLIFQKYFKTLPMSLDESARIDGAKNYTIYARIVIPLCKPAIATVSLLTVVQQWNDFYVPMVLLGRREVQTLPLLIYRYVNEFIKNMSTSFAAVTLSMLPILIFYFIFSNTLSEGLTAGSVKG